MVDESKFDIETVFDDATSIMEMKKIVDRLLDVRQNIDPKSKAFTFMTYTIDNANRVLETLK